MKRIKVYFNFVHDDHFNYKSNAVCVRQSMVIRIGGKKADVVGKKKRMDINLNYRKGFLHLM